MPSAQSGGDLPERVLRRIWQYQQFLPINLRTIEGLRIEVLSPGVLNTDGGPDFRDARIRIGGVLQCGDVELHRSMKEWAQHAHYLDAKYNRVILHVLGTRAGPASAHFTKSKRNLPILVLEQYLHAPFRAGSEAGDAEAGRIPCEARNAVLDGALISRWLDKLALERMELKVRRYEERLRELVEENNRGISEPWSHYGRIPFGLNPEELPPPVAAFTQADYGKLHLWEQLLYEGIVEALGYSKNQTSFLKLARNLRLRFLIRQYNSAAREEAELRAEAALFGVAGLLPRPGKCADRASAARGRKLRSLWRSMRGLYRHERIHEAEWQFFRLRPENFPTLRIAAAARLVGRFAAGGFLRTIIQTIKNSEQHCTLCYRKLRSLVMVEASPFWSMHYRFGRPAGRRLRFLVGRGRADAIVLNAIIPIAFLYARLFGDRDVRLAALGLYGLAPPGSPNLITLTIAEQLIRGKFTLDSARLEQGALHLYRSYCLRGRCDECMIGRAILLGREQSDS